MMFELWKKLHHAPHHLPMEQCVWEDSMHADVDSDGSRFCGCRIVYTFVTTSRLTYLDVRCILYLDTRCIRRYVYEDREKPAFR